jgi:enediyne biosynthesis protein E4
LSRSSRVLAALLGLALAAVWPRPGKLDAAEEARFRLIDVAAKAGITRVLLAGRPDKDHLLDSSGGGAAFLDYDRDGRLDVYLVNGWRLEGSRIVEKGKNALYHGKADGSFEDVTDAAGVSGEGQWAQGVAVADYDNDGWPDILVTTFGRNVLYRNLGNGRFQDVAKEVGIEPPGWNTGASFFDADGDGWLDLYVASYIDVSIEQVLAARPSLSWRGLETVAFGPFGLKGAPDHFFRNDRGKRFVDATLAAGMEDKATGFGFGVRAADLTGDGRVDVYVANDSDPNYLYRNEGGGVFKEIATWSGAALDENGAAQASMGLAMGDVDGDGIPDLFTTNFSEDFSTLYQGLGGGMFEDVSKASGVGALTFKPLSWGTAFADLDNDGALDLLVANGHIYPQIDKHPELIGTYAQKNLLLENTSRPGQPRFRDASAEAGPGLEPARPYRGLAVGDFDNDGRLDVLLTSLDGPPALLHNEGRTGSWLTVACAGAHGEPNPLGTVVTIRAGGRSQSQDIASGDSFLSTHDSRPHFGLGAAEKVDEVDVRWPDGTHSRRRDVPARQILKIRYGS